MTRTDLVSLKEAVCGARFAYAAALVGAHCQGTKEAMAHMKELGRLEKVLTVELEKTK